MMESKIQSNQKRTDKSRSNSSDCDFRWITSVRVEESFTSKSMFVLVWQQQQQQRNDKKFKIQLRKLCKSA